MKLIHTFSNAILIIIQTSDRQIVVSKSVVFYPKCPTIVFLCTPNILDYTHVSFISNASRIVITSLLKCFMEFTTNSSIQFARFANKRLLIKFSSFIQQKEFCLRKRTTYSTVMEMIFANQMSLDSFVRFCLLCFSLKKEEETIRN